MWITGVWTFPSPDAFDPYGVQEGFMADEPIKQWTRLLGSTTFDKVLSISTAADGSIYITGYTKGSFDGQTNSGIYEAFISKYSGDGTKGWTRLLGRTTKEG